MKKEFIHPFVSFLKYTKKYIREDFLVGGEFKELLKDNIVNIVKDIEKTSPELINIFFGRFIPIEIINSMSFRFDYENKYIMLMYNYNILKIKENKNGESYLMWTELLLKSRGVIVDYNNLELISYPFDKFFNIGEYGIEKNKIENVINKKESYIISEKLDGGLGQLLINKDDKFQINSKGSLLQGVETIFATNYINNKIYDKLDNYKKDQFREYVKNNTLIFEIITTETFFLENEVRLENKDFSHLINYPENKIILIGIRNKFTGKLFDRQEDLNIIKKEFNIDIVEYKNNIKGSNLKEKLEYIYNMKEGEGYIITFEDGQKLKAKTKKYLESHLLYFNININYITKRIYKNTINDFIKEIPEEYHKKIFRIIGYLQKTYENIWIELIGKYFDKKLNTLENIKFNTIIEKSNFTIMEKKIFRKINRLYTNGYLNDNDNILIEYFYKDNLIFNKHIKELKEIYLYSNN